MSLHHQSLRRQAILRALGAADDEAAETLPAIIASEDDSEVPELCAEELMFLYGSGYAPFHSISSRETASALG